jgi:hypothetical protein
MWGSVLVGLTHKGPDSPGHSHLEWLVGLLNHTLVKLVFLSENLIAQNGHTEDET